LSPGPLSLFDHSPVPTSPYRNRGVAGFERWGCNPAAERKEERGEPVMEVAVVVAAVVGMKGVFLYNGLALGRFEWAKKDTEEGEGEGEMGEESYYQGDNDEYLEHHQQDEVGEKMYV